MARTSSLPPPVLTVQPGNARGWRAAPTPEQRTQNPRVRYHCDPQIPAGERALRPATVLDWCSVVVVVVRGGTGRHGLSVRLAVYQQG
jgi:hypothetical protein